MKLSTKTMDTGLGFRVTFETAPVVKFHIAASLPDPADRYRADVTITMPEDREDLWLDGINAAFRRVQNGQGWAIRLDYENAIRYFNLDQLKKLDKKNPGFSIHVHSVPEGVVQEMDSALVSRATVQNFARIYYHQRKEAARNDPFRERNICNAETTV